MAEIEVKTEIVVDITVTVSMRIDFTAHNYPDMTLEQALEYERNQDPPEIAEAVVNHLTVEDGAKLSWTVRAEETAVTK